MRKRFAWWPELMADILLPSPQERLASSRKALVRHMTRNERGPKSQLDDPLALSDEPQDVSEPRHSTFATMSNAAKAWWAHQPAHVAVDFVRPVIGRFAERQPLKLLGIAAGIGAAAVLLRPWRLVSIGGLLLAAVKSAAVPSVLLSMLSSGSSVHADSSTLRETQ